MSEVADFGFLTDFDISDNDSLFYDISLNFVYQKGSNNIYTGLVGLENVNSFNGFNNLNEKIGFSNTEIMNIISSNSTNIDSPFEGDVMFIASSVAFSLMPEETFNFSFAFVVGDNLSDLYNNAVKAREKFDVVTSVEDDIMNGLVPQKYILNQNYPNPFNPSTQINFSLAQAGQVQLDIFNVLGQKVKSLISGNLKTGSHTVEWEGLDKNGNSVAGGLYFYRLEVNGYSQSRKMLLLK